MKNEKIEQAISKHLESKVLVLMSYPPEYIEDVKTDMACAFRKGAEWMAGQGYASEVEVKEDAGGYPYVPCVELYDYDKDEPLFKPGDKVVVQIRKGDIVI